MNHAEKKDSRFRTRGHSILFFLHDLLTQDNVTRDGSYKTGLARYILDLYILHATVTPLALENYKQTSLSVSFGENLSLIIRVHLVKYHTHSLYV